MRLIEQLVYKITGDTTSFDKSVKNSQTSVTKFSKLATTALTALSVGAIAGATKKMVALAEQSATTLDTIDKMSQKIGISTEAYQEWDFILSQSGASVDGLQTSMKTLSTAASEAADGTAEYADEFNRLGIEVVDTDGNLKDSETIFNEVFGALSDMEDQTQRTATASKLLGRSATELAPALNTSSDAIEDMRKQSHELGLVLTDEAVASGVALTDTLDQLRRKMTTLRINAMLPLINKMNEVVSGLLTQQTEGEKLEGSYKDLQTALDNYNGVLDDAKGKTDAITQSMISQAKAQLNLALQSASETYKESNSDLDTYNSTIQKSIKWIDKYDTTLAKIAEGTGYTADQLNIMTEQERLETIALAKGVDEGDRYNIVVNARKGYQEDLIDSTTKLSQAEADEESFINLLTQGYLNNNDSTQLLLDSYPELKQDVLDNVKAYQKQQEAIQTGIDKAKNYYTTFTKLGDVSDNVATGFKNYAEAGLKASQSTEESEYWTKLLTLANESLGIETEKTAAQIAAEAQALANAKEKALENIDAFEEMATTKADAYDELKSYYETDKEAFISNLQEQGDAWIKAGVDRADVAKWVSDQLDEYNQKELDGVKELQFAWDELANTGITSLVQGFSDIGEALAEGELSWETMASVSLSALSDVLSGIGAQLLALGAVDLFNPAKAFGAPYFAGSALAYTASGALSSASASYEVGTIDVPKDMTANIHQNEMIIPAGISEEARTSGITIAPTDSSSSSSSGSSVVQLVVNQTELGKCVLDALNSGNCGKLNARIVK